MVQTKYQVFVSSTYNDLVAERDQVIKAVLEMGHIPVGMEMFSAADEQQWQIIARHIDESDYYVAIVAHRYGSSIDGISYTRKEYEYARSRGLPILGFLIEPTASWPADRIDTHVEAKKSLDDFKDLMKQRPVGFWKSSEDLYGKFSVALTKAITASPREGWVRASTAVGPQVTAELSRLSAENSLLRAEVHAGDRQQNIVDPADLKHARRWLSEARTKLYYMTAVSKKWEVSDEIGFKRFFQLTSPALFAGATVQDIAALLCLAPGKQDPQPTVVAQNQVRDILLAMASADLVTSSSRAVAEGTWELTELGRVIAKADNRKRYLSSAMAPTAPKTPDDEVEGGPESQRPAES